MKVPLKYCLLLASLIPAIARADYSQTVLSEKPVAYWRFNESSGTEIKNSGSAGKSADGILTGTVQLNQAGPRAEAFPDFATNNQAIGFSGAKEFIRIKASPTDNPLAFKLGETITIEAWVRPDQIGKGRDATIVSKGRTKNPGFPAENQNFALRLHGDGKKAYLSFIFRDARNIPDDKDCWHRWISTTGFTPGEEWHYVSLSYTFGKGGSIRGRINDQEVTGRWDYGGQTDLGPVVDADEVWIGSSQGGLSAATFSGFMDEVAIYRGEVPSTSLAKRYIYDGSAAATVPAAPAPVIKAYTEAPTDTVRVQILEVPGLVAEEAKEASDEADQGDAAETATPRAAKNVSWKKLPSQVVDELTQPALAFGSLPTKYSPKGIKVDRPAPFLIRSSTKMTLPKGQYTFLLRAHNGSRILVDGEQIAVTPFNYNRGGDAEEVPDQAAKSIEGVRVLPPGHTDETAKFTADGKPHVFVLEAFVGGRRLRSEVGETCIALAGQDGYYRLLSPKLNVPLTDEGWQPFAVAQREEFAARDQQQRHVVGAKEDQYWAKYHEKIRADESKKTAVAVPPVPAGYPANNEIDHFIDAKLAAAKTQPLALTADDDFLRRASIDITGLIPSPAQIAQFKKFPAKERRAKMIDALLAQPGWADNWVSYWQDVLAENPGMLKPMLNNTGPFRGYIYDSFLDNKPMDRFVRELISMEGSTYSGGPAGFSMASQNDVPMAAKAHVVAKAFMGIDLQCARCHDAPYHPFKQVETFSIAAMLKRAPQVVPISSSIPINTNPAVHRIVQVTLAPGSMVQPAWPFTNEVSVAGTDLRNKKDSRAELAELITTPHNERFPEVIVNRIWKRYLGWGLVEPVDDWPDTLEISHPELLHWLAREFVLSGYDVKHVARLILNSHVYQRTAQLDALSVPDTAVRLFAGPARRRLTAEQLVDSLFSAVGKKFDCEELNQDVDGRRPPEDFNNLGTPRHSWEFCSLANERDRPALALPRDQAIEDMLILFGWRESRPNPITVRDDSANVLQPANLANSTLSMSLVRLSDDSALTELALRDQPLPDLIKAMFARVLSRPSTADELASFTAYLEPGYASRHVTNATRTKKTVSHQAVSWSNHLNAEATKIKLDEERKARAGTPPTEALTADWRERMENMVWAMINSPEFVFVP